MHMCHVLSKLFNLYKGHTDKLLLRLLTWPTFNLLNILLICIVTVYIHIIFKIFIKYVIKILLKLVAFTLMFIYFIALSTLAYEKVCILFNIGAMQSQIACSHISDTKNDEGLKLAAKYFQVIKIQNF